MRCLRCDWRSDPEEPDGRAQLAAHADDADHPVCGVCRRSLRVTEPVTCEPCLSESRSLLAGIETMWVELPRHLGQLRGVGFDETVRSTGERPLLGGDALVLAGPGSVGSGARVLTSGEVKAGAVQGIDGREHHQDNYATDAMSVTGVVTQWEDDWRHTWGEPAAVHFGSVQATRAAFGYLEVHARDAANGSTGREPHPDFDLYLEELRQLHGRLEQATGRGDRTLVAEARCLECSGRLVRPVTDEGYLEVWECDRCRREYEHTEYLLVLGEHLRSSIGGWSLPGAVAWAVGTSEQRVRNWADRGLVASACLVGDRRMRVSYDEVVERVRRLEEQQRRRDERAAERAAS